MHGAAELQGLADVRLPLPGDLAVNAAQSAWISEGFRVSRSLPIDGACASFSHNACPHTGKSPCECLVVVLYVSRNGEWPVTIVAHGHEDKTTFSMQPDARLDEHCLAEAVWDALRSLTPAR